MDHLVFLKICFRVKLPTTVALKILVGVCNYKVDPISLSVRENFSTLLASVVFGFNAMRFSFVSAHKGGTDESLPAHIANERPTLGGFAYMFPFLFQCFKRLLAL